MYLIKPKSARDRTTVHISSITSIRSEFTSILQASVIEYHNGRFTKQCTKEQKVLRSCFEAIELGLKRELIAASRTLEAGGGRTVMAVAAVGLASPAAIDTDGEDSFFPGCLGRSAQNLQRTDTRHLLSQLLPNESLISWPWPRKGEVFFLTFGYGDHPNPSKKILVLLQHVTRVIVYRIRNDVRSYRSMMKCVLLTHCGRGKQICFLTRWNSVHLQVLLSATPQGEMFPEVSHPQALLGSLVSIS